MRFGRSVGQGAMMFACAVLGALVGGMAPSIGAKGGAGPVPKSVSTAAVLTDDLSSTPITPQRFLDTRAGQSALDARKTPLGAGEAFTMSVAARGDVPLGATAVLVNITALNASTRTFITVYPTGTTRPLASILNPSPTLTVTNSATVLLADGSFQIYNSSGTVDVIVDVMAYYTVDLTTAVASLQVGDVLVPPSGSGRGFMDEATKPDWTSFDFRGDELAAILDSVQPSPGRYAEMRLEAVVNVESTTTTFLACFRIASDDTGPIAASEVCVDQDSTPFLVTGGVKYFVIEGPVVPVVAGRLYLQAKAVSNINVDYRAFRMFG